jgi:serine/threonine-protein kinase
VIGKTFAHYKITEKLGAGGMGEVWRAHDSKLGRDVALKVVPAAFAQDPERMARFQREAQVLASLNHPHIGAIYGLEDLDNSSALVLELIEGPTLSDRVRTGGAMPVAEALRIAQEMAEAVETAHESGIIHRDLKPANVKLTADGQVKVLDFGLAKAMEAGDSGSGAVLTQSPTLSPITGAMTADNVILGTAGYMSPEQARGQTVDKRADIWAFGVILFEMLTGRNLFTGDTVSDSLAAVLRADPDWEELPPDTPPRIRRLLRRSLEREPKNRLRDMGDARLAIAETIAGVPDTEDSGVRALTAPRNPWPVLVAAVAGAVVAAALTWWLAPHGEELPLRKFAIPMAMDDPNMGAAFEPALSPDGSRMAYSSGGRLWIRNLAELRARELAGTEGARAPFWSPDGRWIGYGQEHELRKISPEGGESSLIGVMPSSSLSNSATACWTVDHGIVFSTAESGLYQIPAQGGDATELVPTGEGESDFHEVVTGPGGRGLVFVVHRTEGIDTIGALTPDGRRTTLMTVEGQTVADPACSPTGHVLFRRYPSADGVWALPVSFDDMEVTGEPFLVTADARRPTAAGGNLVLVTGVHAGRRELVWMNRQGEAQGTIGEPADIRPWPSLSSLPGRDPGGCAGRRVRQPRPLDPRHGPGRAHLC